MAGYLSNTFALILTIIFFHEIFCRLLGKREWTLPNVIRELHTTIATVHASDGTETRTTERDTRVVSSEPHSKKIYRNTFHRQLTEADTDHLLAQDDLALFLQDLDRFKTAPIAPVLPRRTPAPHPPRSRSSSTQSFKTAAEEPENVPVAIDATIRGSINDSSSQEEDDPIDEESFRLEVEGVILEDFYSFSCSEDDTTDDGELSEDNE
ncbi:MAG: hypothetical protein Q9185_004795 [Variospora sp. 1 TL-2023]